MANRPQARTDVNRSAILARLGAHGPASRADLARALNVSPALMTQLTKDLLSEGLLRELEHSPSQGGRPARMLGLMSTAGRAIGVKVVADHVAFVDVGIDGTVVRSASEPFDASASTFLADLTGLLRRFVAGGGSAPLLGVGVGVPGSVDRQANGLVDSTQMGWRQVPLGSTLQRELNLPVIVENNVNALAIAERLYGVGRLHENFLVVTIGTGIGAGIMVDGVVLRGSGGGAGEVGHIPVEVDGPLCTCGNHGCLESIIGEAALVRLGRGRGVIGEHSGIAALRGAADSGNAEATRIFSEAGHVLGRTLAGIVHTLDPEIVIVLGEGTAAWSHWSFGFEPAFRSSLIPSRRGVAVAVETWQDESWAQGAAALVLATPFDAEDMAGDQGRLVRERLVEQAFPQAGAGA
ncbi:ROK family transcriptional regulator [Lacisediminihabitans profunda]|uniref:ROK family transcriptional regulator n=1 Tax=Lacisediminihabitans profunda TaxID=2594790 RepID=A0A5C8ULW4_9MICO|nr:ROK family transcriptional regulator [Lacisediminihabitans profunda]TXN29180.1 ROK family transcriptional regulator [Lacisediminihabitans profunda]